MKKMMLLALAAMSALLALPAVASALPAHISALPTTFTIHGGASTLSTTAGTATHGTTVTGNGSFENTTTGTMSLTFHGVNSTEPTTSCASTASGHTRIAGGGTVTTGTIPFHLVMLATEKPGILVTPNASGVFANFTCAGGLVSISVKGNGVLGEITSPKCGVASTTAKVKFTGAGGVQSPQAYTGVNYSLESSTNGGAAVKAAMNAEATITFNASRSIICTH